MSAESAREVTGQPIPGVFLKLSTARAVIAVARQRNNERALRQPSVIGREYIDAVYDELTRTAHVLGETHGPDYELLSYGLWSIAARSVRATFGDADALRGEPVDSPARQQADQAEQAIQTVVDQVNEEVAFAEFTGGVVFMRPVATPPASA